jgi:NADH-quinone oxidoreductase subunit L
MSETLVDYLWVIIALPLTGSVLLHFFGRRMGRPAAGWLASLTVAAAFVYAVVAALPFLDGTGEPRVIEVYAWIPALGATIELAWDPLAALMTLIVAGVATLIHVFSIGYMAGDDRFGRFFTYLNLFVTSMLILVLAGNFGLLFVGWELVGLCSYLLISFWFTRETAAAAGKKAFIVNRIGDFGFIVALMLIFAAFGTLSYGVVFEEASGVLTTPMATAISLLLLLGATGKSAQLPLYVWLPDAMEGPTPVSALIHAATMVTAGVYMIARVSPIYELAPTAAAVVLIIGSLTVLFAATIAIAQSDMKRVLAYSTISQLGYMFMAVGAAGYVAGIFHLMTHAFFKALLFLGAGSVIHAMADEQNLHKMGGLFRKMPITGTTMAIGGLALAGIVPLAGFWSKDEILGVLFERGNWYYVSWGIGVLTAAVTAFYITRLYVLTFLGEPRWPEGVEPHESSRVMTVPLAVLAVGALVVGFVNTPLGAGLENFLEPSFDQVTLATPAEGVTFGVLAMISLLAAASGISVAAAIYLGPVESRVRLLARGRAVWDTVRYGYYVDDLYGRTIVLPGRSLASWTAFTLDEGVVDGAVDGTGHLVRRLGDLLRPLQSGFVRNYAVAITAGALGLLIWFASRGTL